MRVCLDEAKEFLKIVQKIKMTSSADEELMSLEDLEKIAEEKRNQDSKILMDESLIYIDTILGRISHYKALLDEEKVKL